MNKMDECPDGYWRVESRRVLIFRHPDFPTSGCINTRLPTSLIEGASPPEGRRSDWSNLNINNEKVVLRFCVRFLFRVFPELHWLRQELAGERNLRGISNPVTPGSWLVHVSRARRPGVPARGPMRMLYTGLRLRTLGVGSLLEVLACADWLEVLGDRLRVTITWDGSAETQRTGCVHWTAWRSAQRTELSSVFFSSDQQAHWLATFQFSTQIIQSPPALNGKNQRSS